MHTSSPDWNVMVCLPAQIPCMDDSVLIELWNGETQPTLVGKTRMDFFELVKEPTETAWINFYWRPKAAGIVGAVMDLMNASAREPTDFAGRLLVSAQTQKVQTPSPKGLRSSNPLGEPKVVETVFWIDLYEVKSMKGNVGDLQVQFALGPHALPTPFLKWHEGTYSIQEDAGRLREVSCFIPVDAKQCYDLFIYVSTVVQGGGGYFAGAADSIQRVAFTRMSLRKVRGFDSPPKWYALRAHDGSGGQPFSVLATIFCGCPSDSPGIRPPRLQYEVQRCLFRAMIYEGVNISSLETGVLPSPYVTIELNGQTMESRAIRQTITPMWYEAYELEVSLPMNLRLAPDVSVELFTESQSLMGGKYSLGQFFYPTTKIPKKWEGHPEWFELVSPSIPHGKGKVLCSFELVPIDSNVEDYPFFDDIRPSTIPATIRCFLVGIRMFQPVVKPLVEISYGRDYEDTLAPLWSQRTSTPIAGQEGNWNYLQDFDVEVQLPKRPYHNSFLEVQIRGEISGITGISEGVIGHAYILLTPLLPWIPELLQRQAADRFQIETLEEVQLKSAEKDRQKAVEVEDDMDADQKQASKDPRMQVFHNAPDEANRKVYDEEEHVTFTEQIERSITAMHSTKAELDAAHDAISSSKKLVGAAGLNVAAPTEKNKQEKSKEPETRPEDDPMDFDLVQANGDDELDEQKREEVSYEFEADLSSDRLPYISAPIFKCTTQGVPETIGHLKYKCVAVDKKTRHLLKEFNEAVNSLKEEYASLGNITARCYLLGARGLTPPSGSSDPSVYLWIKNSDSTAQLPGGLSHNIMDKGHIRRQGVKPEFNRCYQVPVALPNHAIIEVAVMNAGSIKDEVIGKTHIDIEDRWFHPTFQALMQTDSIPIELRNLKLPGQLISYGSLRTWLEIMPHDVAQAKPITVLSSPDPEEFQIRVVLWRAKGIPREDNTSVSFFLRCQFQLSEALTDSQDTETHYNSKDGTGIFNWRVVINCTIPAPFPNLKIQVWNSSLLSGEPIGECNIDLSPDFVRARRSELHKVPRSWYCCTNPAYPGKARGHIELELAIMSGKVADINPVGKGNEEPNRDPYLEPITVNRTYIDWKAVGDTVSNVTGSIMSTAKWGLVIWGVMFVLGLVIALIIILK
eukprot:GHVN01078366.1.p1 GENE.GHVN01078366.1~~GHVN01078366.1.p1  ORF type:complete len:1136 (+),score=118.27 GHVN01078366.1:709-4116(+)